MSKEIILRVLQFPALAQRERNSDDNEFSQLSFRPGKTRKRVAQVLIRES